MAKNASIQGEGDNPIALDYKNLPTLLVGPTGHAIATLIGVEHGETPPLEVNEQSKLEPNALGMPTIEVIDSIGELMDEGDLSRLKRLLRHSLTRQRNREAVAAATLAMLEAPVVAKDISPDNIEDDWLNVFGQYSETASSEKMQEFWASVLAGKIRNRSAVSLRTLRILSEIDHHLASLIEKYSAYILNGDTVLPPVPESPKTRSEMQQLHDAGLFTGGYGTTPSSLPKNSEQVIWSTEFGVFGVDRSENAEAAVGMNFPKLFSVSKMTLAGKEIFNLVAKKFSNEALSEMAASLPKDGVSKIWWQPFANTSDEIPKFEIELWQREPTSN